MNSYQLEISELQKVYSRRNIFEHVSVQYAVPGIYGVAGSNGSGKSTFVKIIAGLLLPTSGKIRHTLNGRELAEEDTLDHTGFASPYLNFYEEFSASENIRMLTAIRGMQPDADYEKMLFERFKLYDRRNDQVKAFSSGMKQRLRLIFAFFHRPELVILDEPIANLDNAGKEQIYNLVREERESRIVIIASNDDSDLALCDSIINIEEFKKR